MLPDDWQLRLVDMNVERLKDEDLRWADYVMISAMIVHKESVNEIVERCRKLSQNRSLLAGRCSPRGTRRFPRNPTFRPGRSGGSHAATGRRLADRHALPRIYQAAGRPDITQTPVPRWDLMDFRHYVTMAVQFSRGCPFDCEFCDIIVMNGRVPRTKTPAQLIAELEALRARGWKDMVFIVDDNFIGNKTPTQGAAARNDCMAGPRAT